MAVLALGGMVISLVGLFHFVDLRAVGHALSAADPRWLALAVGLVLCTPFTVAGINGSYDERGPVVSSEAVLWGILYNNGKYDATGQAQIYGSVLTRSGMEESSPPAGTPDIWWDESIKTNWPPNGWELPRVVITKWETDL